MIFDDNGKRLLQRDVTLSAVRLQLKIVNTKQTTHRQKKTIFNNNNNESLPHRSTHILQHLLVLVLPVAVVVSLKRKQIDGSWLCGAYMRSKETGKEFGANARGCSSIKMLLHSVSFHSQARSRAKTYALVVVSNTALPMERAARSTIRTTQQKLFIQTYPK